MNQTIFLNQESIRFLEDYKRTTLYVIVRMCSLGIWSVIAAIQNITIIKICKFSRPLMNELMLCFINYTNIPIDENIK
jgi:hypothetical protein